MRVWTRTTIQVRIFVLLQKMSVPLYIDESKFTCKFGKRTKTEFKVVQTPKQGKQVTKCCSINVKTWW